MGGMTTSVSMIGSFINLGFGFGMVFGEEVINNKARNHNCVRNEAKNLVSVAQSMGDAMRGEVDDFMVQNMTNRN